MKVRKKSAPVEAITFDELVAHGLAHGANVVNGMPWSFKYQGHAVTHENDNCYLIQTPHGDGRFERGCMLVTDESGRLLSRTAVEFLAEYEPAE